MTVCAFAGNADLYGVGIRSGFYILWFGIVLATWLAPRELPTLRHVLLLASFAEFLAVILLASATATRPVELYFGLLLAGGAYYAALPVYLWRLLTGCSPYWDPIRWQRAAPSRIWTILDTLLLLALVIFQLWFWVGGPVHGSSSNSGTVTATAADRIPPLLHGIRVIVIAFKLELVRPPRWLRKKNKRAARRGITDERRGGLALLLGLFRAVAAAFVIMAVELSIQWNTISDVANASPAAQLLPLLVATGLVAHVFWVALFRGDEEAVKGSDDDVDDDHRSRHSKATSSAG